VTDVDQSDRRGRLRSIKLQALVRDHLGRALDARPGAFPPGAALVDADQAWVLVEDQPERGLGPALAWAVRNGALGLHVLSYDLPAGTFAFRSGAVLSGSNIITVRFLGRGGHGSAPHLAADPLPAAAQFVSATQVALSRGISMFEPVTLTFGILTAGTQHNVIADAAEVGGTLRTFSAIAADRALAIVGDVARGLAAVYGLGAEIDIRRDTIPTVCDDTETDFARSVAASVVGDEHVRLLTQPYSISEDFCWILDQVPGVFVMVGAQGSPQQGQAANHSPRAVFDDSILERAADFETAWAVERLALLDAGRREEPGQHGHRSDRDAESLTALLLARLGVCLCRGWPRLLDSSHTAPPER